MVKSPKFNFIGCWSMGFAVCAMGFSDLGHYVMPEDVAHEIAFWMFNINVGMSVLCAVVPVLFTATSQAVTYVGKEIGRRVMLNTPGPQPSKTRLGLWCRKCPQLPQETIALHAFKLQTRMLS
jgi:hypothetical protein